MLARNTSCHDCSYKTSMQKISGEKHLLLNLNLLTSLKFSVPKYYMCYSCHSICVVKMQHMYVHLSIMRTCKTVCKCSSKSPRGVTTGYRNTQQIQHMNGWWKTTLYILPCMSTCTVYLPSWISFTVTDSSQGARSATVTCEMLLACMHVKQLRTSIMWVLYYYSIWTHMYPCIFGTTHCTYVIV